MNGVHDMGGMQDMGPITYEKSEPVFHAPWEGRAFAMYLALDETDRAELELLPPADYLRMSYYERRLACVEQTLSKRGLVTPAEVASGRPIGGRIQGRHVLSAAEVATWFDIQKSEPVNAVARYHAGQRVRARNINPVGHTRLPRYARGKMGTIAAVAGVEPLWDKDGQMRPIDDRPQPVYSVRFAARELWGEQANPRDSAYLDLWEQYLEPA